MSLSVYQFKIVLEDTHPLIWRRIIVPESYSFWDLHVAIQDSMGWMDCHLHSFQIRDTKENKAIMIGIPDDDFMDDEFEILAGWLISIKKYFISEGTQLEYIYDFGDDWVHKITLEKIMPESPEMKYPTCIAGEYACPPEDCGGTPGYAELLEILKNPKHEEYDEMIDWIGKDFDPDEFHVDDIVFDDPKRRFKRMKK